MRRNTLHLARTRSFASPARTRATHETKTKTKRGRSPGSGLPPGFPLTSDSTVQDGPPVQESESCRCPSQRAQAQSVYPSSSAKSQFRPLCESQFRPVVRTGSRNLAQPSKNTGRTRIEAVCGHRNGQSKKVVRTGSEGHFWTSESQFRPDLVRTGSLVVRTGSK